MDAQEKVCIGPVGLSAPCLQRHELVLVPCHNHPDARLMLGQQLHEELRDAQVHVLLHAQPSLRPMVVPPMSGVNDPHQRTQAMGRQLAGQPHQKQQHSQFHAAKLHQNRIQCKKKCVNLRKKVMSDGNFNRALLPSTPYRSGYNMGRSRGIHAARKAMEHVLRTALPQLEEEAVQGLLEAFDQEMKETTSPQ